MMESEKLVIFSDHFDAQNPSEEKPQPRNCTEKETSLRSYDSERRSSIATKMMKLLTFRARPWASNGDEDDKVEMSIAEVQSLRSEISCAEEREGYLRAQLEHIDAILRTARLAGYLHVRMRWTALPGEPPIIEDIDVDDWLPRFVVLHGYCLFFYLQCTDLSPQDTALLSNIVDVGMLRSFKQGEETQYAFYILINNGLRFECSSFSKIQIEMWEAMLRADCNLNADVTSEN